MTINLQTLKCGECGSGVLRRTGLNQYVCAHCGSVSVVEDNVSERLDRVLDQVKDEAARRLAAEQRTRQQPAKVVALIAGGLVLAGLITAIMVRQAVNNAPRSRPAVYSSAPAERPIPPETLALGEPRQVLVGSGSSASAKLLVTVRNQGDRPLDRPGVRAIFYEGDNKLVERSEQVPIGLLMPGESAPMLMDIPSGHAGLRQDLRAERLSAPSDAVNGPRLAFERVRLVQQGDSVRLVGRLVNTRTDATLASPEVMATLYDEGGAVIGVGRGYVQASELKPGERSSLEMNLQRLGNRQAAIAAWDYRIDYYLLGSGEGRRRRHVVSTDRVIRTAGGPEVFNADLRMSSDDLLADDKDRFDLAKLEMAPLVAARSTIQEPVYLTEVVNRSPDAIAVTPGVVISRYDGSRLDGATVVRGPDELHPGERFPVLIEPRDVNRITQTRAEWKPLRRAALPGRRAPLEVRVTGTRAATSSVLVNFSRRYSYKYAEVSGQVRNTGDAIVRKTVLWVSLRDGEGRLTGFGKVEDLPAIGPGESAPFQIKVDQLGRDFATVTTLYQTQ